MPAKALAKAAAAEEKTIIYDVVELSMIVAVYQEELITMSKDLRDARQRIAELEEVATKP